MRIRLLLAAAGTVIVLAGCAGPGDPVADGISVVHVAHVGQSPKQLAESDAARILAAFDPPPGAVRSGRISLAALAVEPAQPPTPDAVLRTSWWRVEGQPAAVLTWEGEHRPAGFSSAGVGWIGASEHFEVFSLPDVPGVLTERWLLVSVASDGPGRTAIRVDAEVGWEPAKPVGERIPAAAKVVTVTPIAGGEPLPAADRPVTLTDQATVTRIAAVVDGLPLFPPGAYHCPADDGGTGILLTFRTALSGPALAVVTGQASGCSPVAVRVEGRSMPTLWHGSQLEQQVIDIAGIHWPGFVG